MPFCVMSDALSSAISIVILVFLATVDEIDCLLCVGRNIS